LAASFTISGLPQLRQTFGVEETLDSSGVEKFSITKYSQGYIAI